MTPTLGSRGCGGSGQEAGVDDELAPEVPVDDVVLEPVLEALLSSCAEALVQRPDLTVSIDDGRTEVSAGETLTYTVAVENVGPIDASGVELEVTLPEGVTPPRRSDLTEVAHRLWRLERDNTIGQLREHGVPVVRWAGAGSLDLVLRDVARMASAPKGALR